MNKDLAGTIISDVEQAPWNYLENVVYLTREIFGQYTIDWGAHKGGINGSNVPIEALSRRKFDANADNDDDDVHHGGGDDDDGDDNFEALSRMKSEA